MASSGLADSDNGLQVSLFHWGDIGVMPMQVATIDYFWYQDQVAWDLQPTSVVTHRITNSVEMV